jgi:hypothetical protein
MARQVVDNPKELEGLRVVQDGEEIYNAIINGESVMHWEAGNSMFPFLMHLEYCKISPIKKEDVVAGMPVFCHFYYRNEEGNVADLYMVHRCTEVVKRDGEYYFRIDGTDNTHFGWTSDVYGVAESTNIFQDEKALWG